MKGVILAAGKGVRLRPLTNGIPKALVEAGGKPLIEHVIDKLSLAGITDICVVVGHLADKIKESIGDGSRFGVNLSYVTQQEQKGLAHAISFSKEFVGDEPFMVILSDNLFESQLEPLVSAHSQSGAEVSIVLTEVDNPTELGVADLDDAGNIRRLVEKPQIPPSNLAITGIYIFSSPFIFEIISNLQPSARGEFEITDAIQKVLESGRGVKGIILPGWWKDTGNLEDLKEAENLLNSENRLNSEVSIRK